MNICFEGSAFLHIFRASEMRMRDRIELRRGFESAHCWYFIFMWFVNLGWFTWFMCDVVSSNCIFKSTPRTISVLLFLGLLQDDLFSGT